MPDLNGNHLPDRGGQPPAKGWEDKFIKALLAGDTIGDACMKARISRSYVCKQRRNRPDFNERWTDALETGTEELERVAEVRAKEGSDQLMIFLLKARRPEVYRENVHVEHSGQIEGSLTVQLDGQQPIQMDSAKRREAARLLLQRPPTDVEGKARDVA